MQSRKKELIKKLKLEPHPEGGYFAEVYRSDGVINNETGDFPDGRNFSTSIYYLLGSDDISKLHRIKSDELWHHYEGSSITIHIISSGGKYEKRRLGKDLEDDQLPQQTVPAGSWFGITVDDTDSYVLCSCTVAPGFDFQDFEMAEKQAMLDAYPQHQMIINSLIP